MKKNMYSIEFSFKSLKNIDDIKDYISFDNEIIADKVVGSILNTIQYLALFPKLWPNKIRDLREIIDPVYKYIIRYKIKGNIIYIVTIYKFKNEL